VKIYYTDKRANGQPIEPGTLALVTDLEDGSHPIWTYARDEAELTRKMAVQNANVQMAYERAKAALAANGNSNVARTATGAAPTAPARRTITGDQIMQATADLATGNPGKAGQAVATLLESVTGVNIEEQARRDYALLALHWEDMTPEFYGHPGNRQLLGNRAIRMAGGKPGAVTEAILTQAFNELLAEGLLFEAPEEPAAQHQPATLITLPGETQVQRTERPRGTRFATGARSTTFGAPQTATTRTLKYTEEQIRTMPLSKQRELNEANGGKGDPDWVEACEYYFSLARATA
jgi:hypothetical protein